MMAVFILAALQLLTGTAFCRGARSQAAGEEPSGLMTPGQYRQFLATLKTDMARWQAQLAEIDVGALGLSFKRGKMVEGALSRAKRDVHQCQRFEVALEKRQTLVGGVGLYSSMQSLGRDVDNLADHLIWMGGDSAQAGIWADELLVPTKEIDEDTEKLLGHVLSLAYIADDSCPQLSRYLR